MGAGKSKQKDFLAQVQDALTNVQNTFLGNEERTYIVGQWSYVIPKSSNAKVFLEAFTHQFEGVVKIIELRDDKILIRGDILENIVLDKTSPQDFSDQDFDYLENHMCPITLDEGFMYQMEFLEPFEDGQWEVYHSEVCIQESEESFRRHMSPSVLAASHILEIQTRFSKTYVGTSETVLGILQERNFTFLFSIEDFLYNTLINEGLELSAALVDLAKYNRKEFIYLCEELYLMWINLFGIASLVRNILGRALMLEEDERYTRELRKHEEKVLNRIFENRSVTQSLYAQVLLGETPPHPSRRGGPSYESESESHSADGGDEAMERTVTSKRSLEENDEESKLEQAISALQIHSEPSKRKKQR